MKTPFPAGHAFFLKHPRWCGGVVAVACGVGAYLLWPDRETADPNAGQGLVAPSRPTGPRPDLREPAENFATFQHVLLTGGCEITRPVAIAWLDRQARENTVLPKTESARVMAMMVEGGHASWKAAYRQHLFNSALNVLHRCHLGEALTVQLLHLSQHDPDRTIRLYALQHLGVQRRAGHLADGPLADRVLASLREMAAASREEVSGYAIDLLASWDGTADGEPGPAVRDLALATAADASRPVDIRVTALHAAGSGSLALARTLAGQTKEHIMLRKAAIACIGKHGTDADFPALEGLRDESARLAQAAAPALAKLHQRQAASPTTSLVPY